MYPSYEIRQRGGLQQESKLVNGAHVIDHRQQLGRYVMAAAHACVTHRPVKQRLAIRPALDDGPALTVERPGGH